jgi:hypothetical protein
MKKIFFGVMLICISCTFVSSQGGITFVDEIMHKALSGGEQRTSDTFYTIDANKQEISRAVHEYQLTVKGYTYHKSGNTTITEKTTITTYDVIAQKVRKGLIKWLQYESQDIQQEEIAKLVRGEKIGGFYNSREHGNFTFMLPLHWYELQNGEVMTIIEYSFLGVIPNHLLLCIPILFLFAGIYWLLYPGYNILGQIMLVLVALILLIGSIDSPGFLNPFMWFNGLNLILYLLMGLGVYALYRARRKREPVELAA